uniref:Tryptophan synthase alpha chain n=1 Tax=Polysiphonia urceolata TaxID=173545 RepID=A0A1Z1MBJ9_POLUR|nr:Tryptophan synthase alpha subunit [Polysiphonia stricta]ARW63468.1 Tryptophan synthase alpha subunit [Polysiphonia stricta]
MNSISDILQLKRNSSSSAFIPFITAGYPNIDITIRALIELDKKGADIIELGIPYADALADGPLIQKASMVALDNGIYIDEVLDILDKVKPFISVPIVIFTYYNPILVRGLSFFIKDISYLGVKGLIIPDLPIEETDYIKSICQQFNIELILFVAPTSSQKRVENIISRAPGCLYLVSSTGVTGMRDSINHSIGILSNNVTNNTNKLVMIGFGVSSPKQINDLRSLKCSVDGIVVGSAFTHILSSYSSDSDDLIIRNLGSFCQQMKLAASN